MQKRESLSKKVSSGKDEGKYSALLPTGNIAEIDLAKGKKVFVPQRVTLPSHFSKKSSAICNERSLNANYGF